jgi:pilus assembly protein CpaC
MLKVKIIEAKRSVLREYGLESDYNALNSAATTSGHFNAVGGQTGLSALTPFATGNVFFTDDHFGPLKVAISALERDGLINTLAEPNLTAISGETAGFLAGGEFPVPTGRDTNGNITIEFKQFGVALNFTPTVLASDRIALQLSTEVSAKSSVASDGVTLSDTFIPGLTTRRAETTVQMGSGGTIMIAGLLKSEDVHSLNGFPGLQDLPVLGELFRSKSFARDESELVVLVTPYLVEPYADRQAMEAADASIPTTARTTPATMRAPEMAPAAAAPVSAPVTLSPPTAKRPNASSYYAAPEAAVKGPVTALAPAPVPAAKGDSALSRTFIANLQKVYGNKAPQKVTTGSSFGYIVD